MGNRQIKLETEITVETSKAKAKVLDFERAAKKLGGSDSLGNILGQANGQFGTLGSLLDTAKGKLLSVPIPAAAAAAAVAGIGAAAYGAGKELFNLAKQGSDLGRSFGGFQTVTGLSAAAVSTLSFEAQKGGKELGDMQKPLVMLNEMLYKAKGGSTEAAESLKKMGITSRDLEGALDQMAKGANEGAKGQERLHNITEILGKRAGPDFLKVLAKMPDGFKAAQVEAAKLGVTLSEDDIKAAKDFGKAYSVVSQQVEIATAKFALQYAPQITGAIKDISNWLGKNQDTWKTWGTNVAAAGANAMHGLNEFVQFFEDHPILFGVLGQGLSGMVTGNYVASVGMNYGNMTRTPASTSNPWYKAGVSKNARPGISEDSTSGGGSGKIHKAPKESDGEFRKWIEDQGFKVNRTYGSAINPGSPHPYGGAADISIAGKTSDQIAALFAAALEKGYRVFDERLPQPGVKQTGPHVHLENAKTTLTKASVFTAIGMSPERLAYLKSLDAERLGKATGNAGFEDYQAKQAADRKRINEEQYAIGQSKSRRGFEEGVAGDQSVLSGLQRDLRLGIKYDEPSFAIAAAKQIYAVKKSLLESELDQKQKIVDATEEGSEAQKDALHDLQVAQTEYLTKLEELADETGEVISGITNKQIQEAADLADKTLSNIEEKMDGVGDRMAGLGAVKGALGHAAQGDEPGRWKGDLFGSEGITKIRSQSEIYKGVVGDLKNYTTDAFHTMASAVGDAVAAWALYGDSIGASMKKAAAAMLASIASQAITQAVWETAQGFAMLALAVMGHPGAGASAASHFTAAAVYGSIGVGAALGAKGLSGKQSKSGAGSGSGSSANVGGGTNNANNSDDGRINFGSGGFKGLSSQDQPNKVFGERLNAVIQTQTMVMGMVEETMNNLATRLETMAPGEVVRLGAPDAANAIHDAQISVLSTNPRATGQFKRNFGDV